jgi:hypothetical protein
MAMPMSISTDLVFAVSHSVTFMTGYGGDLNIAVETVPFVPVLRQKMHLDER